MSNDFPRFVGAYGYTPLQGGGRGRKKCGLLRYLWMLPADYKNLDKLIPFAKIKKSCTHAMGTGKGEKIGVLAVADLLS